MPAPLSPLQKAAILIASLDRDSADRLLEQMDEAQARRVRDLVMQLDEVDPELQRIVLSEFRNAGLSDGKRRVENADHDRMELSAEAMARESQTYSVGWQSQRPADASTAFAFLSELPAATVATALERESPQTTALILAHVSPRTAAAVLPCFSAELQADIARRIIDLDDTDPLVVQELAQALAANLGEELRRERRRASGMSRLAGILAVAPPEAEQRLLGELTAHTQGLKLFSPTETTTVPISAGGEYRTFAELIDSSNFNWPALLRDLDLDTVVLALAGLAPDKLERIIRQLPNGQSRMLQRMLRELGPTRVQAMAAAQATVLAAVVKSPERSLQAA